MKNYLLAAALVLAGTSAFAQKTKDKESIKAMCGCYEVKFEYAETFASDTAYKKAKNYKTSGLEWILADVDTDNKVVLQHLLVINDSTVIKHWRQDWLFQNTDFLQYKQGKSWKYTAAKADNVKGQWTQKVYEVDDSPRYQGSATWVHLDGKNYWENIADAPLPRREYTKRSDYNVMKRTNRHEITSYGHVHEQDNAKVIRSENGDKILAWEKGMNTYKKVDDSKCQAAAKFWAARADYWRKVRGAWDEILARKTDITLLPKVNDKYLYEVLDELEKDKNVTQVQLVKTLDTFISKEEITRK